MVAGLCARVCPCVIYVLYTRMLTRLPHKICTIIIISVLIFHSLRRRSLPRRKLRRRRRARHDGIRRRLGSRKRGQSDDPRTKIVSACMQLIRMLYYSQCIYIIYIYKHQCSVCTCIIMYTYTRVMSSHNSVERRMCGRLQYILGMGNIELG